MLYQATTDIRNNHVEIRKEQTKIENGISNLRKSFYNWFGLHVAQLTSQLTSKMTN